MTRAASAADARACAAVVRTHARTFALASWLLPPVRRRGAFALYAFCRTADDLVDEPGRAPADAARALDKLEARLARALDGATGEDAVTREVAWAVDAFGVPPRALHALVDGVRRDLTPTRYAGWADLARYCEGVASTVGEMCVHVFGVTAAPADAIDAARTLGVAMQLTNILRDVGEDARRGRVYLPAADLVAHGLPGDLPAAALADGAALARDPRWIALVTYEVARARRLYRAALPGIALLAPESRRAAAACATGYAAILDAIERNGHDTLTRRARAGAGQRARALWAAWRLAGAGAPAAPGRAVRAASGSA
ncbi:MAG: phytoene/squalene synthase family protein [Gemmatirosa sp.]